MKVEGVTYEVNWLECANVAEIVYLWQTDSWDAEWHRTSRLSLTYGRS